jgi:hypothetical protein
MTQPVPLKREFGRIMTDGFFIPLWQYKPVIILLEAIHYVIRIFAKSKKH